MTALQQASILTVLALTVGIGFVVLGTMLGVPSAPSLAFDDMGTSGQGYASDTLPSATSSLH